MNKIKQKYITHFSNKDYLLSFLYSGLMIAGSVVITFYANLYATEKASNSVTDIVLDNTKAYDVDWLFVYGPILLWSFVFFILFNNPNRIPFTLKSVGLFAIIRSIFTILTHIAPFPIRTDVSLSGLMGYFTTGKDLFFSGHTGLPFLLALIFWDRKYLRYIFITASLMFAAVVLLGHLHYSIDVLSAFFITYTIYQMAERFFDKDKHSHLLQNQSQKQ
ncbi:MAG: hypothetical protein KGJ58_02460 [Patescibacteria group bacterium]|nr:hypothetical protein [Patescibacteria group bacterium]MDE1988253.1 hypothetical protein [Patescibacteria group bacterium]MDE2218290.1 hypothetical protein [Patescibacteria group bacterium]